MNFFNIKTLVKFTLFFNDSVRMIRSSLSLKLAIIAWTANYLYSYVEVYDSNIWLVLYILDVSLVISCGLAAHYIGFSGFFLTTLVSSLVFLLNWGLQFQRFIINKESALIEFGPFSKFLGGDCGLTLYIDFVSYSFALLTSLIGFCVYIYAFSYMRFEKNILNFLIYFKLFGWSMILLVMAGSWFTLLLGWELIGITSFLLINFWTSKITTLKSAFKAFVFNKISDAALIAAVCINLAMGNSFINTSLAFVSHASGVQLFFAGVSVSYASALLLALIIAAFCKSAQFGFHFWLPDSMEAPVPASALIHSATLVSAGIYLLVRYNSLFIVCNTALNLFMLITAFTAFYGAVIASFQTDVKKILAYSTISHCGMLMFSIIMHNPFITVFYLFAHGFFKSINFMCVGNFIQASNNYQDTSKMGRFFSLFKFEFYFFAITLFNLSSGPLFFCFFSKHWLVGLAYTNGLAGILAVNFIYAAAFCGAFYSSKLLFECMLAHKRSHHSVYNTHALEDSSRLYRRSNFLGRLAMSLLFTLSFYTLYLLWVTDLCGLPAVFDDYSALAAPNVGGSLYAVHLWFSIGLAVTASCYVSFKRIGLAWSSALPVILVFGLFLVLV